MLVPIMDVSSKDAVFISLLIVLFYLTINIIKYSFGTLFNYSEVEHSDTSN